MTPEQWTWLVCSVNVIPENKLLLQEINELIAIGVKLLALDVFNILVLGKQLTLDLLKLLVLTDYSYVK